MITVLKTVLECIAIILSLWSSFARLRQRRFPRMRKFRSRKICIRK